VTSDKRPFAVDHVVPGDCGNRFTVAIRKCDVVCCEWFAAISELACVAISFFFACVVSRLPTGLAARVISKFTIRSMALGNAEGNSTRLWTALEKSSRLAHSFGLIAYTGRFGEVVSGRKATSKPAPFANVAKGCGTRKIKGKSKTNQLHRVGHPPDDADRTGA